MERYEVVSGAISGSLAAALSLTGDPSVAVLAGAGVVPLQFLLSRTISAAEELMARAAASGDVGDLVRHLRERPAATSLLLDAAQAIARTDYDAKIESIARGISGGVLYEEDVAFDTEAVIIRTVIALERPHVAALIEVGDDLVDEDSLARALPRYGFVLPALLSELLRLGLTTDVHDHGDGTFTVGGASLTELGNEVRRRFLSAAEPVR